MGGVRRLRPEEAHRTYSVCCCVEHSGADVRFREGRDPCDVLDRHAEQRAGEEVDPANWLCAQAAGGVSGVEDSIVEIACRVCSWMDVANG